MRILDSADALIPAAGPSAAPTPDVPNVGEGQATAAAVQGLGRVLYEQGAAAYKQAVDMSRDRATLEARKIFTDHLNQLSAPGGFKDQHRLGRSMGAASLAEADFDKLGQKIVEQYSDEVVKDMIKAEHVRKRGELQQEMLQHESTESKKAYGQATAADAQAAGDRAMIAVNDGEPTMVSPSNQSALEYLRTVQDNITKIKVLVENAQPGVDNEIIADARLEATTKIITDSYVLRAQDPNANKKNLLGHIEKYVEQGFVRRGDPRVERVVQMLEAGEKQDAATMWGIVTAAKITKGQTDPAIVAKRASAELRDLLAKHPADSAFMDAARVSLEANLKPHLAAETLGNTSSLYKLGTDLITRQNTGNMYSTIEAFHASPLYTGLNPENKYQADLMWRASREASNGGLTPIQYADDVATTYFSHLLEGWVSADLSVDDAMLAIGERKRSDALRAGATPEQAEARKAGWLAAVNLIRGTGQLYGRVEQVKSQTWPAWLSNNRAVSSTRILALADAFATEAMVHQSRKNKGKGDVAQVRARIVLALETARITDPRGKAFDVQMPAIAGAAAREVLKDLSESWYKDILGTRSGALSDMVTSTTKIKPVFGWLKLQDAANPSATYSMPVSPDKKADFIGFENGGPDQFVMFKGKKMRVIGTSRNQMYREE